MLQEIYDIVKDIDLWEYQDYRFINVLARLYWLGDGYHPTPYIIKGIGDDGIDISIRIGIYEIWFQFIQFDIPDDSTKNIRRIAITRRKNNIKPYKARYFDRIFFISFKYFDEEGRVKQYQEFVDFLRKLNIEEKDVIKKFKEEIGRRTKIIILKKLKGIENDSQRG